MNILGISVALAFASFLLPKDQARIGDIRIYGNTITRNSVIQFHTSLYPGMVLDRSALREARENLIRSGLFEFDPKNDASDLQ